VTEYKTERATHRSSMHYLHRPSDSSHSLQSALRAKHQRSRCCARRHCACTRGWGWQADRPNKRQQSVQRLRYVAYQLRPSATATNTFTLPTCFRSLEQRVGGALHQHVHHVHLHLHRSRRGGASSVDRLVGSSQIGILNKPINRRAKRQPSSNTPTPQSLQHATCLDNVDPCL